MEVITLKLGQDAEYDRLVGLGRPEAPAVPQATSVTIATKDRAMASGRAGAVLAFEVQTPDGRRFTAQATISVRNLLMALAGIRGRYGEDGFLPDQPRN